MKIGADNDADPGWTFDAPGRGVNVAFPNARPAATAWWRNSLPLLRDEMRGKVVGDGQDQVDEDCLLRLVGRQR